MFSTALAVSAVENAKAATAATGSMYKAFAQLHLFDFSLHIIVIRFLVKL